MCVGVHTQDVSNPIICICQVATSEETVPRCDEYSGCPSTTAAEVNGWVEQPSANGANSVGQ